MRANIKDITTTRVQKSFSSWSQWYYLEIDRPLHPKELALKQRQVAMAITSIRVGEGNLVIGDVGINARFAEFYANLYAKPETLPPQAMQGFLNSIQLPKITQAQYVALDTPLTQADIGRDIHVLNSGKAAFLDGILIDLYKLMADDVAQKLHKVFAEAFNTGRLP